MKWSARDNKIVRKEIIVTSDVKGLKEISDYMNSSNQSFFGRYVRRILGVSPSEYRKTREEKN